MHYSLQSRFQGALLGAALGEVLGFQCQTHRHQKSSLSRHHIDWHPIEQWGFQTLEIMPSWSYGHLIVNGIRQLIEQHRWDVETSQLKTIPTLTREASLEKSGNLWDPSGAQPNPPASPILALPIALYFHDDLPQLRAQLQHAIAVWHPNHPQDEVYLATLISTYAIALALHHHPDRLNHWVTELIADLELSQHSLEWVKILTQVADSVAQGTGLLPLLQTLGRTDKPGSAMTGVAIALGSVLNTPDDFRLSVLQAVRRNHHPHWTCTLVGALSGAYNGMAGLPLQWRSVLHQQAAPTSALTALWGIESEAILVQLADQLLAVWAGMDQVPVQSPAALSGSRRSSSPYRLIAAPDVIRPR